MPDTVAALRLQTLGSHVRRMSAAGGDGRVIAVFPRSLYFATADNLICIGGGGLGAGPLNALTAEPFTTDGLKVGTPGQWCGSRLQLGDDLVLDTEAATSWLPPRPQMSSPLKSGLATLAGIIGEEVSARSIGRAIPGLINGQMEIAIDDIGERKLIRGLQGLPAWLGSDAPLPPAIQDMIGLGAGLTPSGDDALGGALIVLHHFGRRATA